MAQKKRTLGLKEEKPENDTPEPNFVFDDGDDDDEAIKESPDYEDEEDNQEPEDTSEVGGDPELETNSQPADIVSGYKVREVAGGVEVTSRAIPHAIDETVKESSERFAPGFVFRKKIKVRN